MIVKLTSRRTSSLMGMVKRADAEMAEAFEAIAQPSTARMLVEAPYAAWLWAREQLTDEIHSQRGTRKAGIPTSVVGLLGDVARSVGFIDRHPGLRCAGVLGYHTLTLPVWKMSAPDHLGRVWCPYPIPGAAFFFLKPHWSEGAGGSRTTTWSPVGHAPADTRLGFEETHLRLWRQSVARLWDEQGR